MNISDTIFRSEILRDDSSLLCRYRYLFNTMNKLLALMTFAILMIPVSSWAACSWNGNTATVATPPSNSELAACVAEASGKTGEVLIKIPDSNVSYSSAIIIDMRSGFAKVTGLTIRGQNDCTLDGKGRPTACGTNISNFAFSYTGKEGKFFRIAHIRITGTSDSFIDGDGKSWRIDHIFYDNVNANSRINWITRRTAGWVTYGVFDHLYVLDAKKIFLHYQPVADGGNLEWTNPLGLGTADAFYFESSKFYYTISGALNGPVDSNGSGKFVIRYNDFTNAYIWAHDAIVNGMRGVRKWEVYNNTFTYTHPSSYHVFAGRGGTGVYFNNSVITGPGVQLSGAGSGVSFAVYRTHQQGGPPWDKFCSNTTGKAILDTSTNYPQTCTSGTGCINIDGSASSPNGYPCRDQLGASGNNPQVGGGQPFLLWNNSLNGDNTPLLPLLTYGAEYMVSGRDWCQSHTIMPASCNGVTTTYTTYTYPHPLVQEVQAKPSPPQNLR